MALTWRNVDAPDFRGALTGLAQSNQMLGDALGTASKTLGSIDADKTNQANRQIQMNALKFQDPAAYAAALQSGELTAGVDPTRIDAATLAGLDNRSASLLDRHAAQYKQGRTEQTDTQRDAAAPAQAAMNAAYASGDPAQIARVQQEFGPALAKLSGADNAAQWQTAQGLEAGGLGNNAKRFSNDVTQTDYNETRQAQDLFTQVRRQSAEGTDALAAIEQMDMPAGVRTKLNSLLGGSYGDLYGAGAGGAPGTGSFTAGIPFAETKGYVSNIMGAAGPVSGTNAEKAAKLLPHLIKQESGGRDNAVSSKGAQGRTQVMPQTGKDPGYGVKPMADDSPAEFERFGKEYLTAMLDKYDGDPEKALAAYNAGPGNVDKWVSSIPSGSGDRARSETSNRYMQNTGQGGAATRLAQNFGSNANASEIAQALTKEGGAYAGGNAGRVSEAITRVMTDANVNAAQAGDILAAHPEEATWLRNAGGFLGGRDQTMNLGGDMRIDDTAVKAEIASHNSGRASDMMQAQTMTGDQVQALSNAEMKFQSAQLAYQSALAKSKIQPGLEKSLPRLREAVINAEVAYQNQLATQRSSPDLQARRIAKPENQPVQQQQGGGLPSVSPAPGRALAPRDLLLR